MLEDDTVLLPLILNRLPRSSCGDQDGFSKRMSPPRQSQENSLLEKDILFLNSVSGVAFGLSLVEAYLSWVGWPIISAFE